MTSIVHPYAIILTSTAYCILTKKLIDTNQIIQAIQETKVIYTIDNQVD